VSLNVSRRQRLWIPDLALALSLLTLFYCLFVFDGWRQLFRDSDTGWHIRTGDLILDTHQLPIADPFSFSRAGQRWFAWEWGADVAMSLAHRAAGLSGVALLYSLAIAVATYLWVKLCWQSGSEFASVCLTAIPMLSTVNLHWLARPHIFSWILLLAALLFASRREIAFNARGAAMIAALSLVWTNLHASFFLLPVMLAIFAVGNQLERWLFDARRPLLAVPLAKLAVVAVAASLLNPYGWFTHSHVAQYLTNSELLDRVGEFQSFNFHVAGAWQILLLLGLTAFGGACALSQGKVSHFFWIVALLALALRSARGLPLVALAALPLANGAISVFLREGCGLRPRFRAMLFSALEYSQRLRQIDRQLKGWATVPALLGVVVLAAIGTRNYAGFPADQFPVTAAQAVAAIPREARILAPDKFGGYLIYRFRGERKVFFDGRSDFYGADFMKRYIRLVEVRPGWRQEFDSNGFTHALLPNTYSLIPALEQTGWKVLHRDNLATLLGAHE
jgi:hypothetical protein